MAKRSRTPGARRKVTPPSGLPAAPRATMVTISDAETTESARQESMRDGPLERATMPAPPAAIGRFSIEMHVPSAEIDYRALFERGAYREGLAAARERLSVSPADTSALRIAQRCEEALAEQLTLALGGAHARIELKAALADQEGTAREHLLLQRLEAGSVALRDLLHGPNMGRIEALDLITALQARGHLRVNLSDQ